MSPAVYVNGRFLSQRTTGVQRVARCLLHALDAQRPPGRWVLLCPPGVPPPPLRHVTVRSVGPAGLPLHLWEQAVLPWAARDGWLLSLAGTAPALGAPRQVVTLHDAAVFDRPQAYTAAFVAWYRWLHRRLARQARAVVTVSAFSRGRLQSALGLPAARVAVVHNGADHLAGVEPDLSVLDRHGLRGQRFLLSVASANPTKNLARLLAAWAEQPLPGVQLVLAGGGNARVFAGQARALPPGVLSIGTVDDAQLVALYRHALGLVFPSVYEGFGLPPLEAMACGCPVAAARAAAVPEVCGDAVLYFDPTSQAEIRRALHGLSGDADLRQRLRLRGAEHVAPYTWARAARALLSVLESLP
jgi:glycosyltransferase involved in cell wall biosynthesis